MEIHEKHKKAAWQPIPCPGAASALPISLLTTFLPSPRAQPVLGGQAGLSSWSMQTPISLHPLQSPSSTAECHSHAALCKGRKKYNEKYEKRIKMGLKLPFSWTQEKEMLSCQQHLRGEIFRHWPFSAIHWAKASWESTTQFTSGTCDKVVFFGHTANWQSQSKHSSAACSLHRQQLIVQPCKLVCKLKSQRHSNYNTKFIPHLSLN